MEFRVVKLKVDRRVQGEGDCKLWEIGRHPLCMTPYYKLLWCEYIYTHISEERRLVSRIKEDYNCLQYVGYLPLLPTLAMLSHILNKNIQLFS